MPERLQPMDDQASGLRRLFGSRSAQAVAFVAGRETSGRTTLLIQTAEALARAGNSVLLIDEHHGPDSAVSAYGLKPRYDLLDLVQSDRSVQHVLMEAGSRVHLVSAHRLARELRYVDHEAAIRLDAALRQMQHGVGYVLLDCLRLRSGHLSPLALAARHMAVVVAADSDAITNAYALIKSLSTECGRDSFQVVVTRARSRDEASAIFENMRKVAQDKLRVRLHALDYAHSPESDDLATSLKHRLPMHPGDETRGGFTAFAAPLMQGAGLSAMARAAVQSVV